MDDLRRRLHEASDAHQPDRDAMLVRIERGMTRSTDADRNRMYRRRRQASWLKVSLAAVAGVGVLGLGGLALAAGVQQRAPQRMNPVATATDGAAATPNPLGTRPATTASPAGQGGSTARHSAAPTAPTTPTAPFVDGPISASAVVNAHSTVYWEQNDLTLELKQPLTALTVELTVPQTAGVVSTGYWQTAPTDDFTISVTQEAGFLVYRWVLKPGHTVPAAQQIFAAQFNHATGKRDASKDTFRVQATAAGRAAAVHGDYPAGS